MEGDTGTALRTGIRLGVKSSVCWIVVFCITCLAHGEDSHGGFLSVVRDAFNNGISWAAIGAVDKGVMESPVLRVEKLLKTVTAEIDIGGDCGVGDIFGVTAEDREFRCDGTIINRGYINGVYNSKGWCFRSDGLSKGIKGSTLRLGHDTNACTSIDNTARDSKACS